MSWEDLKSKILELNETTLGRLAFALMVAVSVFFVGKLILRILQRRVAKFAATTKTDVDDVIADLLARTRTLFLFALGIGTALWVSEPPDKIAAPLRVAVVVLMLGQVGIWASTLVRYLILNRIAPPTADPAARSGSGVLVVASVAVVWVVVGLLTLENLGVDITALIAGLGVGGIAIALATQNILGDLFGSISILLDKPFVIGDFIVVGDMMGSVEHIGIKTTRVRSLGGEQIVLSNNDLLTSRIRNFKRMQERRVVFSIGVTYQTPPEKLEKIPGIIRRLIESLPDTRFDRCHFMNYGSSALEFETVFFVLSPDFSRHADLRQQLNLGILREFRAAGVEFAYPTQQLFVTATQPLNAEVSAKSPTARGETERQ